MALSSQSILIPINIPLSRYCIMYIYYPQLPSLLLQALAGFYAGCKVALHIDQGRPQHHNLPSTPGDAPGPQGSHNTEWGLEQHSLTPINTAQVSRTQVKKMSDLLDPPTKPGPAPETFPRDGNSLNLKSQLLGLPSTGDCSIKSIFQCSPLSTELLSLLLFN